MMAEENVELITDGTQVRSLVTFSEKFANYWAVDVTDDKFGKDGMADRCSRLLIVFHSWRGLEMLSAMRWELYSFLAAMIAL